MNWKRVTVIVALGLLVGFFLIGIAFNGEDDKSEATPQGLTMSRQVLMQGCEKGFEDEYNSPAKAKVYCGCLYDEGVNRYGAAKLTDMIYELGQTNQVSPELNSLINTCVGRALE